jgi:hypothetical protein
MKLNPLWLLPLIVVVIFVTVQITNHLAQPQSVIVRITDGPTVLSTQVVPLH